MNELKPINCDMACGKSADRQFSWPTSRGPQHAALCKDCADRWWAAYKNTNCGQGLIISPLETEGA